MVIGVQNQSRCVLYVTHRIAKGEVFADIAMTNMKISSVSISLLILIMFFGCSELDKSFQEPLPDNVTYVSHIKAILDQSCVRCHGGSAHIPSSFEDNGENKSVDGKHQQGIKE